MNYNNGNDFGYDQYTPSVFTADRMIFGSPSIRDTVRDARDIQDKQNESLKPAQKSNFAQPSFNLDSALRQIQAKEHFQSQLQESSYDMQKIEESNKHCNCRRTQFDESHSRKDIDWLDKNILFLIMICILVIVIIHQNRQMEEMFDMLKTVYIMNNSS
jgi:hypothetical protein